jgi:hypothetical protein
MLLPSDTELAKLQEAGLSHQEIADRFNVSRQAVTKRFNNMGEFVRAVTRDVAAVLPWDLSQHPAKSKLKDSVHYLGLRAFVRQELGFEVSNRGKRALTTFTNHVRAGEVLELDEVLGFVWAPYVPARDGDLVIRWPKSVPQDDRANLLLRSSVLSGK